MNEKWQALQALISQFEEDARHSHQLIALFDLLMQQNPQDDLIKNQYALFLHRQGMLMDAEKLYEELAGPDPEVCYASATERDLVLKFAPRLFAVKGDPFPLKESVAVLHPEKPLIAYHFFWENDWDFPDGYEPCDHELVWVELDEQKQKVKQVWSYFHRRILSTSEAVEQSVLHDNRPAVYVQWGKHGSLIDGMRSCEVNWEMDGVVRKVSIEQVMKYTHEKSSCGGRKPEHPVKRQWVSHYQGSYDEYVTFDQEVELKGYLQEPHRIWKTAWASAVMWTYVLGYPFSPKPEWPR